MIICPRCGFEQPNDVFCAKCGISVEGYVAKKPPLGDRLKKSPIIFGLLMALGVTGIYYSVYYRDREQDFQPLEVAETQNVSGVVVPKAPPQGAPPQGSTVTVPSNLPTVGLTSRQKTFSPQVNGERINGDPNRAAPAAQPENSGFQIDFTLASREGLEKLGQDSDRRLEVGVYGMAIVPQFKAHLDALIASGTFRSLAVENRNLAPSQPSLVFRGGKEPKSNDAIGFYVEVTPARQNERNSEFKISIKRSLPEVSPTGEIKIVSQNFPDETVVLPRGYGVAIAGVLPRKNLYEGEDDLYKTNVLKALLEPAFQKGEEEFILMIYPHMAEITHAE